MKKFVYILTALSFALISCNKDTMTQSETVQLSYAVSMPGYATKATTLGDASHVDELICAVFENGVEHQALRKTIKRNADGTFPMYQPSLYLGKTYQIVFWAHKEGYYNVTDLTEVTYGEGGFSTNDENADAFTLTQTVRVNPDKTVTVGSGAAAQTMSADNMSAILKRPFAKVVVRTLASDWLDTATHSRITLSRFQTHFNALTGSVTEDKFKDDQEFSAEVFDEAITVNGEEYIYVSFNYLFPGSNVNVKVDVASKDFEDTDFDEENDIISTMVIPQTPVVGNKQTNVTVNAVKATLDYTVSIDPGFDSPENNIN